MMVRRLRFSKGTVWGSVMFHFGSGRCRSVYPLWNYFFWRWSVRFATSSGWILHWTCVIFSCLFAKRWFPKVLHVCSKLFFLGAVLCHSDSQHDVGNFGDDTYFEQGASPWLPAICSFPDVFQEGASCIQLQVAAVSLFSNPCIPICSVYGMVHSEFYCMRMVVHPIGWNGAFVCGEIVHAWSMAYSYQ